MLGKIMTWRVEYSGRIREYDSICDLIAGLRSVK